MRKFAVLLLFVLLASIAQAEDSVLALDPIVLPDYAAANEQYLPEKTDTIIILDSENTQITGTGAIYENNTLTISQSGNYYLTGTLNGSILIDSPDTEKVSLIFNGVSIQALNQSCVAIPSSGKNTTITLAEDSVNLLETTFITDVLSVDGAYDATIYSKADLRFKGTGSLYISCSGGKGINCRDDVTVQSCSLYISATDDGLRGKDSVSVSSGLVRITAGADGIRSTNEEKENKGFITISGGQVMIDAALDGVQAYSTLTVSGGDIICVTGGGAKESVKSNEQPFARGGGFPGGGKGGPGWNMNQQTAEEDTAESTKGLKSDTDILITGGNVRISSLDDAIHANQNATVSGGKMELASGDDGIHAEKTLLIEDGNILISQSFEGIESSDLQITGGETRLYASDDGVNAAGGEKTSTTTGMGQFGGPGGRGGFGSGGMLSTSVGQMKITGGYLVVNSSGDGVDVNGSTEITGGTLIIYGPSGSGNAALDYDEVFTVSGGTLLATGSYGMAQTITPAENVQMLAFTCNIPAETLLYIADSSDQQICAFTSPKSYSCVIFASDMLKSGESYQVYADGSYSSPDTDGIYSEGTYSPGTLLGSIDL